MIFERRNRRAEIAKRIAINNCAATNDLAVTAA